MRVAIVYDALWCRSGGERVLLDILDALPGSTTYTMVHFPDSIYPEFKKYKIKTTWLQKFVRNEKWAKRLFFPFGIIAMRHLRLEGYDFVIMVSTHCAKYISIVGSPKIICYCFTPFRLAWNPESYQVYSKASGIRKEIFNKVISCLRLVDRRYSIRIDRFITMTRECEQRIRDAYDRNDPIGIIPPAIDIQKYKFSKAKGNYYLVVSRLESYKRVDLAIDACVKQNRRLIVVGRGPEKSNLVRRSNENVTFLEALSDFELVNLYSNAKALIFPQHEDYGLTPLEANASGTPVIAYGKGGVCDTMIPYRAGLVEFTAVFFENQTVNDVASSIEKFEELEFDPDFLHKHARSFSREEFILKFRGELQNLI